jgi:hypothetical protein
MGADFVDKATPTFKKGWDRERVALAEGDLLSRLPTATLRSFTAVTCAGANLRKGDRVTVEKVGSALVVISGHSDLARAEQPAPELLDAVAARCNVAPAVIDEVYSLAGIVDVIL